MYLISQQGRNDLGSLVDYKMKRDYGIYLNKTQLLHDEWGENYYFVGINSN